LIIYGLVPAYCCNEWGYTLFIWKLEASLLGWNIGDVLHQYFNARIIFC
jgi:hypothetical protein